MLQPVTTVPRPRSLWTMAARVALLACRRHRLCLPCHYTRAYSGETLDLGLLDRTMAALPLLRASFWSSGRSGLEVDRWSGLSLLLRRRRVSAAWCDGVCDVCSLSFLC
jgi:hypothetical protein